jgi:hypothetical protein
MTEKRNKETGRNTEKYRKKMGRERKENIERHKRCMKERQE